MPRKIEISHRTIIFTVLFLIFIWFLYLVRGILFQIFIALLLTTILNPTVTKLQRLKIPRVASVLIVYFLFFGFLAFSIAAMIPPLVEQSSNLASSLPTYLSELKLPSYIVDQATQEVTKQLGTLPSQVLRIGVSLVSNIISVLTVLIIALYFLMARNNMHTYLSNFLREKDVDRVEDIVKKLESRLGGWARGQLILMFMIGLANYVGLLILGVPFALPLGLLAGILEIVPNIGPILAAIPAVIVGFGIAPVTGFAVAALAFLIQQIEIYVFVPKVMERSAGVNPVVTLLALIMGFKVAGVVGAILAIPVVIMVQVLSQETLFNK